jgi:hypothetical protein
MAFFCVGPCLSIPYIIDIKHSDVESYFKVYKHLNILIGIDNTYLFVRLSKKITVFGVNLFNTYLDCVKFMRINSNQIHERIRLDRNMYSKHEFDLFIGVSHQTWRKRKKI